MTQIATVERIIDNDHAEISVPRKSACGHGCGVSGAAVHAKAVNTIGAQPGQKVVVESSTKKMLNIVMLVYLIPVVLFMAGYLIMAFLSASVGMQYFVAAVGFVIGIIVAIFYDRRLRDRGGLVFTIVRLF